MSLFPDIAPQLAARGYRPVPIKAHTKRPPLKEWQNYAFSPADAKRFKSCGAGILCGEVLGVDIDIPDVALVGQMIKWLMQRFGRAPARFGNKPKCLLLYRAATPGVRKHQTSVFANADKKAKVEILADGQQFVAFAIHPDTGKPYEWHAGSPLEVSAADLQPLTDADIAEIVEHADQLLSQWGTATKAAPAADPLPVRDAIVDNSDLSGGMEHAPPTRLEMLEDLVDLAEYDAGDHDSWMRAGAALHHETGGSNEGLDIFIAYSRCLSNHDVGEQSGEAGCALKWNSFGRSHGKPTTWGTIKYQLKALRESGGK